MVIKSSSSGGEAACPDLYREATAPIVCECELVCGVWHTTQHRHDRFFNRAANIWQNEFYYSI